MNVKIGEKQIKGCGNRRTTLFILKVREREKGEKE